MKPTRKQKQAAWLKTLPTQRKVEDAADIRQYILDRLLYFFIGVLPIVIWPDEAGTLRYVVLAGFLLAGSQVIGVLTRLREIVDARAEMKKKKKKKKKGYEKELRDENSE